MAGQAEGCVRDKRRPLLLFDAECVLCNGSVRWLVKRDRGARLSFAPLSWRAPRIPADSMVLLDEDGEHFASEAALRVAALLPVPWCWLRHLWIIPRGLRDAVYRWIARNRLRWFGSQDACEIPAPGQRARFPGRDAVERW